MTSVSFFIYTKDSPCIAQHKRRQALSFLQVSNEKQVWVLPVHVCHWSAFTEIALEEKQLTPPRNTPVEERASICWRNRWYCHFLTAQAESPCRQHRQAFPLSALWVIPVSVRNVFTHRKLQTLPRYNMYCLALLIEMT